jgi:hypothetical protein
MSQYIEVTNGAIPPQLVQVPIDDVALHLEYDGENIVSQSFTYAGYTYKQTFAYQGGPLLTVAVNSGGEILSLDPLAPTVGSGASLRPHLRLKSVQTISAPGTGYTVGNTLTAVGGTGTPCQIQVTAINGSGGIVGASVAVAGTYTALPGQPVTFTGGSGTGASAFLKFELTTVDVISGGDGYTDVSTLTATGNIVVAPAFTLTAQAPATPKIIDISKWLVQP